MKTYLTVFFFFLCNAIGFSAGPFLYVFAIKYELVNVQAASFNAAGLQYDIITAPILMWVPCFFFSFSVFFLKGSWRKFFFLAPIIAPLMYAAASLQAY